MAGSGGNQDGMDLEEAMHDLGLEALLPIGSGDFANIAAGFDLGEEGDDLLAGDEMKSDGEWSGREMSQYKQHVDGMVNGVKEEEEQAPIAESEMDKQMNSYKQREETMKESGSEDYLPKYEEDESERETSSTRRGSTRANGKQQQEKASATTRTKSATKKEAKVSQENAQKRYRERVKQKKAELEDKVSGLSDKLRRLEAAKESHQWLSDRVSELKERLESGSVNCGDAAESNSKGLMATDGFIEQRSRLEKLLTDNNLLDGTDAASGGPEGASANLHSRASAANEAAPNGAGAGVASKEADESLQKEMQVVQLKCKKVGSLPPQALQSLLQKRRESTEADQTAHMLHFTSVAKTMNLSPSLSDSARQWAESYLRSLQSIHRRRHALNDKILLLQGACGQGGSCVPPGNGCVEMHPPPHSPSSSSALPSSASSTSSFATVPALLEGNRQLAAAVSELERNLAEEQSLVADSVASFHRDVLGKLHSARFIVMSKPRAPDPLALAQALSGHRRAAVEERM